LPQHHLAAHQLTLDMRFAFGLVLGAIPPRTYLLRC
jgi:hypothetical protein